MPDQDKSADSRAESEDLTGLLNRMFKGDREAGNLAAALVERELHILAQSKLNLEQQRPTFETRDLIQELYARLFGSSIQLQFENRKCFYGLAVEKMRQILIDRARGRKKREGNASRENIDSTIDRLQNINDSDSLLLIDRALIELKQANSQAAQVAELKFYGGLTFEEIAETLAVSVAGARRSFILARRFLSDRLANGNGPVAL